MSTKRTKVPVVKRIIVIPDKKRTRKVSVKRSNRKITLHEKMERLVV
jgi:hypothetical protein